MGYLYTIDQDDKELWRVSTARPWDDSGRVEVLSVELDRAVSGLTQHLGEMVFIESGGVVEGVLRYARLWSLDVATAGATLIGSIEGMVIPRGLTSAAMIQDNERVQQLLCIDRRGPSQLPSIWVLDRDNLSNSVEYVPDQDEDDPINLARPGCMAFFGLDLFVLSTEPTEGIFHVRGFPNSGWGYDRLSVLISGVNMQGMGAHDGFLWAVSADYPSNAPRLFKITSLIPDIVSEVVGNIPGAIRRPLSLSGYDPPPAMGDAQSVAARAFLLAPAGGAVAPGPVAGDARSVAAAASITLLPQTIVPLPGVAGDAQSIDAVASLPAPEGMVLLVQPGTAQAIEAVAGVSAPSGVATVAVRRRLRVLEA